MAVHSPALQSKIGVAHRNCERFHLRQTGRGGLTFSPPPPRAQMLAKLFPDDDYKFHLRFERGEPAEFFSASADRAPLLEDAIQLAESRNGFVLPPGAKSAWEKCLALGQFWEPDYLLLRCDADGE